MHHLLRRPFLFALAILPFGALSAPAQAQTCSTLTPDVTQVSVTLGGIQNLQVSVPPDPGVPYHFAGALSVTPPFFGHYQSAGIFLPFDRYMIATYTGRSPFLPNGVQGTPDGHTFLPDPTGSALMQVQVPPQLYAHLVGYTFHHAIYRQNPLTLLPACGSNVVPLTLVP